MNDASTVALHRQRHDTTNTTRHAEIAKLKMYTKNKSIVLDTWLTYKSDTAS